MGDHLKKIRRKMILGPSLVKPGIPPMKGGVTSVCQARCQKEPTRGLVSEQYFVHTRHGGVTGIWLEESCRAAGTSAGCHFRLFHFFGWHWVFTR